MASESNVMIYTKSKVLNILFTFFLMLYVLSCNEGSDKIQAKNEREQTLMIVLSRFNEEGNCKRTIFNENTQSTSVTCNRYPRGICNIDLSIVSSGEITFQINEGRKLAERVVECDLSFLQSGILSTTSTSQTDEQSLRKNVTYITVASCEADGILIPEGKRLTLASELTFLESARGKIGRTASILRDNIFLTQTIRDRARICLSNEFTLDERSLFDDLKSGKVITEIAK